jgi:hypothetical protein
MQCMGAVVSHMQARVPRMYGEFLRRAAAERMCHDVFLKDTSNLFGNGEYLAVFLIAHTSRLCGIQSSVGRYAFC